MLLQFWLDALDPVLESVTKSKASTALHLLLGALNVVSDDQIDQLLTDNALSCLTTNVILKEEPSSSTASEVLESLKSKLIASDVQSDLQVKVIEKLLKMKGLVAFDKTTETKFMEKITPHLKKGAVENISIIYRQCVEENGRTQDRISAAQNLAK